MVRFLLCKFAEQEVESAVHDAHALDVVQRRLGRFEKDLQKGKKLSLKLSFADLDFKW